MKLSKDQTKILLEKLRQHWIEPNLCPICHNTDWKIPESILEIREYEEGDLIAYPKDSSIIPLVSVTCTNCGYTFLINAITIGLMEDNLIGGE